MPQAVVVRAAASHRTGHVRVGNLERNCSAWKLVRSFPRTPSSPRRSARAVRRRSHPRNFVLHHRFGLLGEAKPRERDIEYDGLVFGSVFALRLTHALRSVLPVPGHATHRLSPSLTHGPLPRALSMQGNYDELRTALRQNMRIWNPVFVGCRPAFSFLSARLANQWLLPPLTLAIVEPRFGAAPHMFGDAIGAEDPSACDRGRGLAVEPREDIMPGVLAPDNDSRHDRLLSAPLVSCSPSQRGGGGTGSIQKSTRGGRGACDAVFVKRAETSACRRLRSGGHLKKLDQRVQGSVDRRRNAENLALARDIAVDVIDLGALAAGDVLGRR